MALRFFWRLVGSPLDGTHDYTAGANSASTFGTGSSFDATSGLAGANGLLVATNAQGGRSFSASSLVNSTVNGSTQPLDLVMSAAWSFKCIGGTSFQTFQRNFGMKLNSAIASEEICVDAGLSPARLALRLRSSISGSELTKDITLSHTIAADQWYGVVIRLDVPNDKARIELYTHAGTYGATATLVDSAEDTVTALDNYIISNIIATSGAMVLLAQAGTHDSQPVVFDNWMIADAYDEPLENNLTISSYTEYTSSVVLLYPVMEPLYYGALLADKTNIQYMITAGHTNFAGDLLDMGVNATTDSLGVPQFPHAISGLANDPVTVHLYWEEGNPAVDRSLIVKTTLVEAI